MIRVLWVKYKSQGRDDDFVPERRVTPHRCLPVNPASFKEHIQGKLERRELKSYLNNFTFQVSLQAKTLLKIHAHDFPSSFSLPSS